MLQKSNVYTSSFGAIVLMDGYSQLNRHLSLFEAVIILNQVISFIKKKKSA